ncbi:hypothetical protein HD806DRAFT_485126 [Xylariaceae sp. AK1471]|nr:hypothetical protein HD806DRAFT_485126 [Xylariaceae sp. AK1471]
MPSSFYRVYIRFGKNNCVRFFAPGDGIIARDGLELFEWIRNPSNITRLRNGLRYVYEIDRTELHEFLEVKLREDTGYMEEQMKIYKEGSDMLTAFEQKRHEFNSLRKGVDKLEAISNAQEVMVIPRASPRKRSDRPGWLYLLNLDQETLEVYEFKDYKLHKSYPFARLTIKSLYEKSPDEPPGYYIKLKLSELQAMWRSDWITEHEIHADALDRLWRRNATVLQTTPHADNLPFAVLYGSVFYRKDINEKNSRRSRRLTQARLTEVLAALNRRQPSKMPIFERETIKPRDTINSAGSHRPRGLQDRITEQFMLRYQRSRARKG